MPVIKSNHKGLHSHTEYEILGFGRPIPFSSKLHKHTFSIQRATLYNKYCTHSSAVGFRPANFVESFKNTT